ncbi:MAG: Ig-like domain-containing protein, partial [Mucispirillum sp.]|nr:Ig-like domain-containing protein [Mucispirillum sp.]
MKRGNTADVNLTVLPADASDKRLSEEYTNGAFSASIQGNLLKITALKTGSGVITVTSVSNPSVNKEIRVNIIDSTIHPEKVSFSKDTESIDEGETKALSYNIYPANADNTKVTFTSSNTDFLRVDDKGNITGVKAGSATVTVETADGKKTDTITVTVTKPHIALKGISINPATIEMSDGNGNRRNLPQVTFTPDDATNKNFSWSSSDENVIKIEGDEVVVVDSFHNDRTANLIVTSEEGGHTAQCTVTVKTNFVEVKVTKVKITNNFPDNELKIGAAGKLSHSVSPADATDQSVKWTSSDENVITVDENGNVKAVGEGFATITVSSNSDSSKKDEYNIYVWEPADKISGSYAVESLNITYNGKEYKSSGADKSKPYHYDMAAFAIKIDGKSMDISGKFQLVWS